ncbi:MAG: shikimate kinase [Bacteroidales bacterium]|nr:shikimate kinase [Bacteroidales bacterium]
MLVFLVGFMGSGKSTYGPKLAEKLEFDFIDTDELIETVEQLSVNQIFAFKGEEYFRQKENEILQHLSSKKNLVIATGGGMPCHNDNMEKMRAIGLTVYLKAGLGCIMQNLLKDKGKRPLIDGVNPSELADFISDKLDDRKPCYQTAQLTIVSKGLKSNDLFELVKQNINPKQ